MKCDRCPNAPHARCRHEDAADPAACAAYIALVARAGAPNPPGYRRGKPVVRLGARPPGRR